LPGNHPLKDAHAELDEAVLKAYGFNKNKGFLEALLDLNALVVSAEENGEAVQGPGLPDLIKAPQDFISDDCLKP